MGQSFTGAALQSIGAEPSLYRAPDGTLFTVDSDGRAVGLDGVALSPVPSGNAYLAGEVLGEGDVPEFVADLWVKNGIAKPVKKGK